MGKLRQTTSLETERRAEEEQVNYRRRQDWWERWAQRFPVVYALGRTTPPAERERLLKRFRS